VKEFPQCGQGFLGSGILAVYYFSKNNSSCFSTAAYPAGEQDQDGEWEANGK